MSLNQSKKGKILIFSTAYLPMIGGSELAIKNVTDRLSEFDFDLITARSKSDLLKIELIGNTRVYRVGSVIGKFNFFLPKAFLPLAVFFKAIKLIKNNDYICMHAYQASGAAGAGWLLKFLYPKLPLIITLQEGKNLEGQGWLINFFRKLILKKADRATAISNYLKNYIFKINPNLRTELISNGVDIDKFSREFSYGELTSIEESLGIKPDDKVIVTVSRLVSKNGVDILIEALNILKSENKSNTKYKLLIVGDGQEKAGYELRIKNYKIENSVIFAGSVDYDNLSPYLKVSDVFVRPSRSEGLGTAFLEAMAAGIPVIGTNVGGISDFLEDRKTGLLTSLSSEDVAFKIRVLLENDNLRKEIIRNAYEMVVEKYNWNLIADQFRKLYLNIWNLRP